MKKANILFLIGILFTAVTFTSCEKIADGVQDALELTINTDFSAPFVATPTDEKANADGSYNFKEVAILDPSQNADLAEYLQKIQSIDITTIEILITSVSNPNLVLRNGEFTLTDNVTGDTFTYHSPENTAIAMGTTLAVEETNPGWDIVNQIVDNMHASTIVAVGGLNQDDFEIEFEYIIKVKVVVNP